MTQLSEPPTATRYGTVHQREDDYQLRFERHYAKPIARVWAALTTPAQLAQWFAPGELALTLGGSIHLAFTDGQGVIDGEVTALERGVLDPDGITRDPWNAEISRLRSR